MVVEPPLCAPAPAPAPFNPEALTEAITNREKTFKNAGWNVAQLRVTLGGEPPEASASPLEAIIPTLSDGAVAFFEEKRGCHCVRRPQGDGLRPIGHC